MNKLDLSNSAVEHIRWVSKWQAAGYILLGAMRDADRSFVERCWPSNRDPELSATVRDFILRHAGDDVTFLYSANSFSKKEAKAHLCQSKPFGVRRRGSDVFALSWPVAYSHRGVEPR